MKVKISMIVQEFENNGKLSNSTLSELRKLISSKNQYSAISIAADCKAISLAPEIAKALKSNEVMIRWIAISTLLSRFKLKEYATQGVYHAEHDADEMVKGIAISGLGEILPLIEDEFLRKKIALLLISTLDNESDDEYINYKEDAYYGILAAMKISPLERTSANKPLNIISSKDTDVIAAFKKLYLVS